MSFTILDNVGTPQKFTDDKTGKTIHRQDQIFVKEWGQMVPTAPYDDHFVYENNLNVKGTPAFMCTCGAAAVVVPPFGNSRMFVCLNHATFGFHATSQVNKKDFEKGIPIVKKGRKWQ